MNYPDICLERPRKTRIISLRIVGVPDIFQIYVKSVAIWASSMG
jgi:hypothetical protein